MDCPAGYAVDDDGQCKAIPYCNVPTPSGIINAGRVGCMSPPGVTAATQTWRTPVLVIGGALALYWLFFRKGGG